MASASVHLASRQRSPTSALYPSGTNELSSAISTGWEFSLKARAVTPGTLVLPPGTRNPWLMP